METRTVGIFGLGLIGMALAERLLSAGHSVNGFDIDFSRSKLLDEMGGKAANPELVWQSESFFQPFSAQTNWLRSSQARPVDLVKS